LVRRETRTGTPRGARSRGPAGPCWRSASSFRCTPFSTQETPVPRWSTRRSPGPPSPHSRSQSLPGIRPIFVTRTRATTCWYLHRPRRESTSCDSASFYPMTRDGGRVVGVRAGTQELALASNIAHPAPTTGPRPRWPTRCTSSSCRR